MLVLERMEGGASAVCESEEESASGGFGPFLRLCFLDLALS